MKQTAIEWLVEQIENHGKCIYEVINQAKAMEKEQMKNACIQHQYENKAFQKLLEKQFEQYYNETYEQDKQRKT